MKILQIHNYYQYKGGEDSVVLAEKQMLEQSGHIVISLTAHNNQIKDIFKARKSFYKDLETLIENYEFDIAHLHNVYHIIGNDIYEFLAKKKIPIVQTLHNFRFLCPAGLLMDNKNQICEKCLHGNFIPCFKKKCYQHSYIKSLVMQWYVKGGRKNVLQYVDTFIALNPYYKQKFIEAGFVENKIVIKPNFINSDNIKLSEEDGEYALFVGRLSPEKGLEILIKAFSKLSFPLKIAGVGDESYMLELKQLAKGNPNIEFVGFIDGEKKQGLLNNCSFVIVPSIWYENFPVTILEAYSFGKPVIASNIGGLPYLVKDKETGLLFEASSDEDLTRMVKDIILDKLYLSMGKTARYILEENFSDQTNVKQLVGIYESLILSKNELHND